MSAAALELDAVARRFDGRVALDEVALAVAPGELFCLLGPSGSGKTTLLRIVGGYLAPERGRVLLAGDDVTDVPPERRDVGTVFQSYALFPHLDARENVAFGLRARHVPRAQREARVEAMLDRVGLAADERRRRPRALSGGQQQRVALARALVIEPRLLLLDEPFANLDRRLREQLRAELRELQARTGVTTLLVTHDQEEALSLATRVGVLAGGRLLQVDPPDRLYRRPRHPFVARFVGEANLLPIESRAGDRVTCLGGLLARLPAEARDVPGGALLLLRPEHLLLGAAAAAAEAPLRGRVRSVAFLGTDSVVEVEVERAGSLRARVRAEEGAFAPGDLVPVAARPDCAWPLDDDPGAAQHGAA